nr:hypothetical protein [uncultured Shinella sp.]
MNRAFSLINVKSFDEEERVIEGIATTPACDRVGDCVISEGAVFNLPLPLLLDHNAEKAVGHVESARVTSKGIAFKARIAKIDEPGPVKDLVDSAWQMVRHKLRAAVSIGFRALPNGAERMQDGGVKFTSWEWLELSLCVVPANSEALILTAKKLDPAAMAALRSIDKNFPKAGGAQPVPAPLVSSAKDIRTTLLSDLDAEIARLDGLISDKRKAVSADEQRHPLDQNMTLQRQLNTAIHGLQGKRGHVEAERLKVELADEAALSATSAPAPKRAARSWPAQKALQIPEYPVGARQRGDREAIEKALDRFIEYSEAETVRNMSKAFPSPDSPVPAEFFVTLAGVLHGRQEWTNHRLKELEERVSACEATGIKFMGVWQRSAGYQRGSVVSHKGCAWCASSDHDAPEEPGQSHIWQLMVKAGRDGKDAR